MTQRHEQGNVQAFFLILAALFLGVTFVDWVDGLACLVQAHVYGKPDFLLVQHPSALSRL